MVFTCPCCKRKTLTLREEYGSRYCPYCACKIEIVIAKRYVFVLLFFLFAMPFLFIEKIGIYLEGYNIFTLLCYNVLLFIFALTALIRLVQWKEK